jgi:uncharacterized membrane protein
VSRLSRRERKHALQRSQLETEFSAFQGPLPPPAVLAEYDRALPGAADRIIGMAERQSAHRQELEATVVRGNVRAETRGQVFAFILGMTAIVGGIGLIAVDRSAEGLGAIIVAFTGLAAVFIYGRYQQNKERERKRQKLEAARQQPLLPVDDSNRQ